MNQKPQFTNERCKIHDLILHEYNGDGEKFARPSCLSCIANSGRKARILRSESTGRRGFYLTPWTPWTRKSQTEKDFGRRLIRYLIKIQGLNRNKLGKLSFEELSRLVADTEDELLQRLREFENDEAFRHGKKS